MRAQDSYETGLALHGDKCPAIPMGLRVGAAAMNALGVEQARDGQLVALVELGDDHCATCFTDGIQTDGDRLHLRKGQHREDRLRKLALTLIDKKRERSVRVSYRGTHQEKIAASAFMRRRGQGIPPTDIPEEEAWELLNIIWEAPEAEVLVVGEVRPRPFSDLGEIMSLHPCADCGELVSIKYLRVVGKRHV